ncbi:hypothetical protein BFW38_16210 [Terasakiispira papahanaumokuakeensis]|uniref:Guanylate cyclase domain-containing protein n=1 Tax=Terasakiispira papahanaumokuakeensis TaxID=197479 RepID=A0A1E2VD04_9GAMM|nr:CHASE2 domain-containing protein [Terasakiispira papahanaumokuakeensis]ODC04844.1 hypothetical protein BFW38_16210 [Terasakiispira papahanaumokuakeensis]
MKARRLPPSLAWSFSLSPRLSRLIVLLLAAGLTWLCLSLWQSPLRLLEERVGAMGWVWFPEDTAEQRLTLVAIDERSLSALGSWPWPRQRLQQLSQDLSEAGVSQQLYDIVLPESRSGDHSLAATLHETHAVLAQVPLLQSQQPLQSGAMSGAIEGMRCRPPIPVTEYFLANQPDFSSVAKGYITPIVDEDGMIRRVPPLICVEGKVYPSLALSALVNELHQGRPLQAKDFKLTPGHGLFEAPWILTLTAYPNVQIPLDHDGNMRLDYRLSPNAFTVVPALDVLQHQQPDILLDNTWALVGATAFGLGDVVPTPHQGMTPGVELQARMIASLLDDRVPYTPKGWLGVQLLLMLVISGVLWLLASRPGKSSFLGLPLAGLVVPALAVVLHSLVLLAHNIWLGWLPAALFANVAAALLLLLEYGRVRVERLRVYNNLSSYLPGHVAHEIAYHQPTNAIQARRQKLVVLCADLRNYSAFQDAQSAEAAAALLHCFFVEASSLVESCGGSIHEFKGDAIIATWSLDNALAPEEALSQAVQASVLLVTRMQEILPQHNMAGLEPMSVAVGLESGTALVGSIGPAHRRHHALMGRPLTSALRIQAMTADLGQPVLIGEQMARQLKGRVELRSQGQYILEGLRQPSELYALLPEHIPEMPVPDEESLQLDLRLIKGGRSS